LLEAISRKEFNLNGLRNRDLRLLLFTGAGASKPEQCRHAATVSRKLALLRAHRLINKVAGTHRYHLSRQGRINATAKRNQIFSVKHCVHSVKLCVSLIACFAEVYPTAAPDTALD
jgi:hypothetical protein